MRKGFFAADLDFGPNFPAVSEVIPEEGSESANGLINGGAFEFAFRLEVEEEVENEPAFERRQVLMGEMVSKLPNPTEVGFDRAFAESFELDKAGEFLIPLLRSEAV